LDVAERAQGAKPGEAFVSMTKKRYRLPNSAKPSLTLLHYLAYSPQCILIFVAAYFYMLVPRIAIHPSAVSQHTVSAMPRINPAAQANGNCLA
jgi:hypothetical protein